MDETALAYLPLERLAPLVAKGKISPVELVELAARRIERLNPALNAFLSLSIEPALDQARRAEREIRNGGWRGPLHGIPVSIKDNIATRNVQTTAGSKIPGAFPAGEEAAVARRLRRAGAIVIGKTNLHEFAYGVTSENPHYGPVHNPWDRSRMAGGSSGGSAASLAAGIGWGSIGTDTGGSLRIPASLCGVVALKPTFGRVSRQGVVPLSTSLDHVGPLATSVTGAAWLLGAIAGRDRQDDSTAGAPMPEEDYAGRLRRRLGRVRLGLPREFFFAGIQAEVRSRIEAAAREMERLGAEIEEIHLPGVAGWVREATPIALAEARHYHESTGHFPSRAAAYGAEVRRLLEHGGEVAAFQYLASLDRMREARAHWDETIEGFDALLAPATPMAAPLLGQQEVISDGKPEKVRAALLRLCRPANFTGAPALVLPCGFTDDGLPIGLQLIGQNWSEARLLRIGYAYEQAAGWLEKHPAGGQARAEQRQNSAPGDRSRMG
ncbi:MAG TPA: amidase [Patescibacteria group bacterium]|nr:amidase [Patescibacteria group bacterium]